MFLLDSMDTRSDNQFPSASDALGRINQRPEQAMSTQIE
jgi:hypothetical protein